MIESLRIEHFAVVDEAELEFGPGLNVLTGETGAGKSIVLGALALLAGGRASPEVVREGAEEARVEAVFRTESLAALEAALTARGLAGDPHELVVQRSVGRSARSRARVAGQVVPASVLAELFAGLLEVSSQHESQALRRPEQHGRLLDAFGGLLETRARVAESHAALRALDDELGGLRADAEERARREDFLRFQLQEIDEAAPEAGEGERLALTRGRLAHAERLAQDAGEARALLAGDELGPEAASAADLAGRSVRSLEAIARLDPEGEAFAARARGLEAELRDLASELERYAGGLELDPGQLAGIEERLALLERLRRKYGGDEAAVLAFRDGAAAELAAIVGSDDRLAKLEGERAAASDSLAAAAKSLSRGRTRAARALSKALAEALSGLALEGARFEVALPPVEAGDGFPSGPSGREQPAFQLAANPGEAPRPLHRIASGGELSRLFLALKNVTREADSGMVLVFDEVDAGVGGRVADRVGRVLAELAREHQVLCITHLPQIAAQADVHFRVAKGRAAGRAVTRVERLEGEARVDEIARMAGGEQVSAATRRHAEALLAGRRRRA